MFSDFKRALIGAPLNVLLRRASSVFTASDSEVMVTNHVSPTSLRTLATLPQPSKIASTSSGFVEDGISRKMMVVRSDLMLGLTAFLDELSEQTCSK